MAYEVYSHNFTIYFWDVYLIVTEKIFQLAQPLPYSGKDVEFKWSPNWRKLGLHLD